jgi:Aspartyl protease
LAEGVISFPGGKPFGIKRENVMALLRLAAIAIAVWASLPASAACKLEKNIEYPLAYRNGMPVLFARARDGSSRNNQSYHLAMGIDTGASTSVSPKAASMMHAPRDPHWRTRAIGTTGTLLADHVKLRDFEFAGKVYHTFSAPKIPLPPPLPSTPAVNGYTPLDGIIGGDVLSMFDVDLDLGGKSITFYEVRGCTHVTPPWTEPYASVPIKVTSRYNIVVPVEVDGHKLPALLDTGSTGYAITRRGALRSGATEVMLAADPTQEASGIGGIKKQPFHKFKALAIGGETIPETGLLVMDAELPHGDVLIGQSYLMFRRVWISYSTRMLFIGAPKAPSAHPPGVSVQPTLLPNVMGYGSPCVLGGCTQFPAQAPPASGSR